MNIYVFGLGHIGLPLAASICLCGKEVQGIDINSTTIKNIETGNIDMYEYYKGKHISKIVKELIEEKKLNVNNRFIRISNEPSVFIFTVGIGTKEDKSQDLSALQAIMDEILPKLIAKDLLIFRTTMIPGTCENFIYPQLKALNTPVYLAYCPETIAETCAFEEFENNSKVLAGIDEESYMAAEKFLGSLSKAPIYKASNIRTAEMIKVVQNIHRDVNIALANELSEVAHALNIDIYEVQPLVNTHPRVELLKPGPGVGGYCIPNALGYLKAALDGLSIPINLMNTARNINDKKPYKVVNVIKNALRDEGKDIKGASIAVLGLAMKDYCADCRLSPALDIVSLLIEEGAEVKAFDPLVNLKYPFQVNSLDNCIIDADCMVITANQPNLVFDLDKIKALMSSTIIIDTRNIFPSDGNVNLFKV